MLVQKPGKLSITFAPILMCNDTNDDALMTILLMNVLSWRINLTLPYSYDHLTISLLNAMSPHIDLTYHALMPILLLNVMSSCIGLTFPCFNVTLIILQ
jgi:hypothetical protein